MENKEFVLPKKWCIKAFNHEEEEVIVNYVNAIPKIQKRGIGYPYQPSECDRFYHFPMYNENCVTSQHIKKGYQEITFEQFKKYVLKEGTMENKKIVGYKLIKPEYKESVRSIINDSCWWPNFDANLERYGFNFGNTEGEFIPENNSIYKPLKNAGVLNLWFEPVYKSRPPQIEINGYKGKFFDTHVIFGCASISKEIFENLYTAREYKNTNRDIESVTIGKGVFSKEVIEQIAEYYIRRNES